MSDRFIANGSMAHTVGNVTYKFTNFMTNFFGKNFFKYVHVDTRMAWTEFDPLKSKVKSEFIKKNRPILTIKPTVDLLNKDIFLSYSHFTTNTYGHSFQNAAGFNFMPLFKDLDKGNSINYLLNRIRVVMDVTMLFDTIVEQINVLSAFTNRIVEERPYYMPTALENHIPKSIIDILSLESGIPVYNKEGSTQEFLKYMNMNSVNPITFKEKCATGKEEFFVYYPLRIEYVISDINVGDVDKRGAVSVSAPISFTLTAEFNTIGSYEYLTSKNDNEFIKKYDYQVEMDYPKQNLIIPFFTYDKMFESTNQEGWRYFNSKMYKVDYDDQDDITDLTSWFNGTLIEEMVAYHDKHGIPHTNYIEVRVMKGDKEFTEGKEFVFDYKNLQLITKSVDLNATYRVIVYTNNEYINQLVIENNVSQTKYDTEIK